LLKNDFKSDKETAYTDLSAVPLAIAKKQAAEGYEGLIYVPKNAAVKDLATKVEYISNDSPDLDLVTGIETVINDKLTRSNLKELGFDYDKIEKAKTKSDIHLTKFSGEESFREGSLVKIVIGGLCGYLIMMFIIIYGNMVMRSVIEEKTNRIIEIIISSVKPFQLMMGKIIGTSLAGILQFVIWSILGVILFTVLGSVFDIQMGGTAPAAAEAAQVGDGIGVYINEIFKLPLFTMFYWRLLSIQFHLCCHWRRCRQRNRFAAVPVAYYPAAYAGCICRFFYSYRRSSRYSCHHILYDTAYIAHSYANASAIWSAPVAVTALYSYTVCHIFYGSLVCL
jgi:ABC-2 type transport system permease protein